MDYVDWAILGERVMSEFVEKPIWEFMYAFFGMTLFPLFF